MGTTILFAEGFFDLVKCLVCVGCPIQNFFVFKLMEGETIVANFGIKVL